MISFIQYSFTLRPKEDFMVKITESDTSICIPLTAGGFRFFFTFCLPFFNTIEGSFKEKDVAVD